MRRFLTLLVVSVLSVATVQAGGPWPRAKKSGYAQFSATYLGYSSIFGVDSEITPLRRNVTDITSQLYVEYGITDKLTLTANLPFKYVFTGDEVLSSDTTYFRDTVASGNLFGLNTVLLGLKYNIINKRVLFSAGLNTEANVAKYDSTTTLRTGPSAWVIHPFVSVGTTFFNGKLFTFLDAGYRLRTHQYSDEFDFNFELGYSWNYSTYFIFNLAGRISVQEGSFDNGVTAFVPNGRDLHTNLYPNNQQYVGYGVKFIQKIKKKVHINAAVYSGFGNMVAAAPTYNLGVAYEW